MTLTREYFYNWKGPRDGILLRFGKLARDTYVLVQLRALPSRLPLYCSYGHKPAWILLWIAYTTHEGTSTVIGTIQLGTPTVKGTGSGDTSTVKRTSQQGMVHIRDTSR